MATRMRIGADEISSLPDNVREKILMFLPLREAAKASILSSRWRNMWTRLPTLVFDESFCQTTVEDDGQDQIAEMNKLMFKLCTVLLLHRGPLQEFSLSLPILRSFPAQIDQILLFLQEKGIESLTITVESRYLKRNSKDYKLLRHLFSFSQLKILRLSCCQFKSSCFSFECFSKLTVLELRNVIFDRHYKIWSFRCPLLSALTLIDCGGIFQQHQIVIEAPKLCCFHFDGGFSSLQLNNTPFLKTAILHKRFSISLLLKVKENPANLLELWSGLAAVELLSVSGYFYQYLRQGHNRAFDLSPLWMLRHMKLDDVCLNSQSVACSVLRMIKSSPNLQQLSIWMVDISSRSSEDMERFYGGTLDASRLRGMLQDGNDALKHELSRLTRVEVKRLKGTKHETAFLEWLLSSSPALDLMEIRLDWKLAASEKVLILRKLNGFQRASTRARIIVKRKGII